MNPIKTSLRALDTGFTDPKDIFRSVPLEPSKLQNPAIDLVEGSGANSKGRHFWEDIAGQNSGFSCSRV